MIAARDYSDCPDAAAAMRADALARRAKLFSAKEPVRIKPTLVEMLKADPVVTPEESPPLSIVKSEPACMIETPRDWLRVSTPNPEIDRQTLSEISRMVTSTFGASIDEVKSTRRSAYLVEVRHTISWICRRFTLASYNQIASRTGGRDHTTIMYGINKMQATVEALGIQAAHDTPEGWAKAIYRALRAKSGET